MDFPTLDDITDQPDKIALVRGDIDVPIHDGSVTDDLRLRSLLPTVNDLLDRGFRVIIIGHLGRPKGEVNEKFSLKPVAAHLSNLLDKDVAFFDTIEDARGFKQSSQLIAMLENTRFHKGETENSTELAAQLAGLGDIYVNNAFASAHRAHASVHAITEYTPSFAGRLIEKEIGALQSALSTPERPAAALSGGAKISTKLPILNALISKVDYLIVGGAMANTFVTALEGVNLGKSLCEHDMLDDARSVAETAKKHGCTLVLPTDFAVAKEFAPTDVREIKASDALSDDDMALDIGDASIAAINEALSDVKTLLWNGPLGAFEVSPFDVATTVVAQYAAERTNADEMVSVAGGGDTAAALAHCGVSDDFTYISTAGGAFLEYMEGKELPALAVLTKQKRHIA